MMISFSNFTRILTFENINLAACRFRWLLFRQAKAPNTERWVHALSRGAGLEQVAGEIWFRFSGSVCVQSAAAVENANGSTEGGMRLLASAPVR